MSARTTDKLETRKAQIAFVSMGVLFVLMVLVQVMTDHDTVTVLDASFFDDERTMNNTVDVVSKRASFASILQCNAKSKKEITAEENWFAPPDFTTLETLVEGPIKECSYSFLDLGVRSGESLGYFIDAGIPECDEEDEGSKTAFYNVHDGSVSIHLSPNGKAPEPHPVTAWAKLVMEDQGIQTMENGRQMQPEEYCYYGMEAGKQYKSELRRIETIVINSKPRPVRLAKFFTETMPTVVDGPTKYTPPGTTKSVTVDGMTLTRLLDETCERKVGNHIMIRVNSLNAYAIIREACDSGQLCEYSMSAIRLDILVQGYSVDDYTENHEYVETELKTCGVRLYEE